jgi:4-azaleucine resistance transporter AzlC
MARTYRDGVRAVVPLSVAVLGFGVAFGVLATSIGMGTVAPIVLSATTFAGSAQFAAASVLADGGAVTAAIAAGVLLNARYGPIGVTVAPWLEGGALSRFLHAQLTVDESWALAAEPDGRYEPRVLLASGVGLYVAWVGGTTIGVAIGDVLPSPDALGLDAAFPALFLALVVPQLRGRRIAWLAAALGAAIALALTPIAPPSVPIVAAAAATLLGLRKGPS